jgi:glycosyltransferase involved in cell wall biosynthesis
VIVETCRRLVDLGHATEIWCPDALADSRESMVQGLRVRRFPYFYPYIGLGDEARRQMDFTGGNLFSPALGWRLLREPGLDLVHLHTGLRLGGICRTVARLRRIPYVVSLHGGFHDAPAGTSDAYTAATRGALEWGKALGFLVGSRRVLDDAAAVLVLSRREQAEVARRHPRTTAVYFPNGVDPDRFASGDGAAFRARHGIAADAEVVLCVGRIDPQKDQVLAVRATAALARERPRLRLVLAGHVTHESYSARLAAEIDALGVGGRVTVIPGLAPAEVNDAYHAADAFVLPSVHEPFGIVILEAWASGLPVVATRVGGVVDLVRDREDGWLVDSGDATGLAAGIRTILDDRAVARTLGEEGRKRARGEFSWDAIARRLVGVYEDAIARRL